MPELPEVEALVEFLTERAVGRVVARIDVAAFSVLKTYDPPLSALQGLEIPVSTARQVPGPRRVRPVPRHPPGARRLAALVGGALRRAAPAGQGPAGRPRAPRRRVRLRPDRGGHPEAAGHVRRALAVRRAGDRPARPRPARPRVRRRRAGRAARRVTQAAQGPAAGPVGARRRRQRLLRRGAARRPAVAVPAGLVAVRGGGRDAVRRAAAVLRDAVARAGGLAAAQLKKEKKTAMRVHGRTGQPCPVCGDTVREVSFADSSLQYCPTCQTGGKPLADRRLSRLLK